MKPIGYYVQRIGGLFPAPLPQDSPDMERVEKLFYFLGILLAKCLQDSRLIDIPLSIPFLKLMCMGEIGHTITQQYSHLAHRPDEMMESWHSELSVGEMFSSSHEDMEKELILDPPKRAPTTPPWYDGILVQEDFEIIDPHRASFLKQLSVLVQKKQKILKDKRLSVDQKNLMMQDMTIDTDTNPLVKVHLDDLG